MNELIVQILQSKEELMKAMDSYFEPKALLLEESYFKYKQPHAIAVIRG